MRVLGSVVLSREFDLLAGLAVLERTPVALRALLAGLPDDWTTATEGPETWSPYDVVGHLIHGERTDWIARAEIILAQGENRRFTPFDRFAQFRESQGKTLVQLLDEFAQLRAGNLAIVDGWKLTDALLALEGDFSATWLGALLAFGAPLAWSVGSYASRKLSLPAPAMASAAQWLVGHHREQRLGGAGNVALNLRSMGAQAFVISVTGDDDDAAHHRGIAAHRDRAVPGRRVGAWAVGFEDAAIAATAAVHDLTVITANIRQVTDSRDELSNDVQSPVIRRFA